LAFAAADDRQKAMMLLLLNGAFNKTDLVRLNWQTWDEIKSNTLISNREKTGNTLRATCFWPETIAAVNKLPRDGEFLFYGQQGAAGTRYFEELWKKLRKKINRPSLNLKQFRSGAATAVMLAGVPKEQLDMLMGHSGGIDDHYILANPQMVKPACDAVYKFYFAASQNASVEASR